MAISRSGLSLRVPWRRGAGGPDAFAAVAAPGPVQPDVPPVAPEVAALAPVAATPAADRAAPRRGPDGRFVRRAAAAEPQPQAESMVAATLVPGVVVPDAGARVADDRQTAGGGIAAAAPVAWSGEADATRDLLSAHRPIRIVLVEDVPDVVTHVRGVLRSQPRFQLVHVIADGRRAVDQIRDLHPDVVLVDALLQGRTNARDIVEGLRASGSPAGVVALTVPDHDVDAALARHADGVVTLPLGTFDVGRAIIDAHAASAARDPSASSRIVAVFSAKGGVGKTTIAFNLAASLAATGLRTVLVDGSLQFGDVRRLLRADPTLPSVCDLPTDGIRGSDVADVVVRDRSGIDLLLAPPRPELAELVNSRDLEQLFGILRRAYQAVVIDTPSALDGPTLRFLDAADLIIDVLTADSATLELAPLIAATFADVGYPAAKVRFLLNRFDALGAAPASQVVEAIGRQPDYTLASDWQVVSSSNAASEPFVLARPDARVSADLRRIAEEVRAVAVRPLQAAPVRRGVGHR